VGQHVAHLSLIHGFLPVVVQVLATAAFLCGIGRRSRRWRVFWLPVALVGGGSLAVVAHWYINSLGVAGDPAPTMLSVWIAAAGMAVGVLVLGWRGARWWRRGVSMLAVPLCVLCAALAVNLWVGYFATVYTAWNQLTAGPLPDQTDRVDVTVMQVTGARPANGVVVPVTIPADASHFKHRQELVYLPPAWFSAHPAPRLPTVMMIGAQLNTPADWLRAGRAVQTVDDFARAHGGNAPVVVFVDATGAFDKDTECVNGSRGNAADHLTKDVVSYMVSNFRVSADRSRWGFVGWSMGGTCAVDLTVMHPELFSAFVDIAGDGAPNVGTKAQTIATLFGGNTGAYAAYDPTTVINKHGHYSGVAGWFEIPGVPQAHHRYITTAGIGAVAAGAHDAAANPEGQDLAANSLCAVAGARHPLRGRHRTRQARLAVRGPGVRHRVAVAGRSARHTWRAAGRVAGADAGRCFGQGSFGQVRLMAAQMVAIHARPSSCSTRSRSAISSGSPARPPSTSTA
jgi:S-formylglutathione hydrolase FrmB